MSEMPDPDMLQPVCRLLPHPLPPPPPAAVQLLDHLLQSYQDWLIGGQRPGSHAECGQYEAWLHAQASGSQPTNQGHQELPSSGTLAQPINQQPLERSCLLGEDVLNSAAAVSNQQRPSTATLTAAPAAKQPQPKHTRPLSQAENLSNRIKRARQNPTKGSVSDASHSSISRSATAAAAAAAAPPTTAQQTRIQQLETPPQHHHCQQQQQHIQQQQQHIQQQRPPSHGVAAAPGATAVAWPIAGATPELHTHDIARQAGISAGLSTTTGEPAGSIADCKRQSPPTQNLAVSGEGAVPVAVAAAAAPASLLPPSHFRRRQRNKHHDQDMSTPEPETADAIKFMDSWQQLVAEAFRDDNTETDGEADHHAALAAEQASAARSLAARLGLMLQRSCESAPSTQQQQQQVPVYAATSAPPAPTISAHATGAVASNQIQPPLAPGMHNPPADELEEGEIISDDGDDDRSDSQGQQQAASASSGAQHASLVPGATAQASQPIPGKRRNRAGQKTRQKRQRARIRDAVAAGLGTGVTAGDSSQPSPAGRGVEVGLYAEIKHWEKQQRQLKRKKVWGTNMVGTYCEL